MAKRAEIDPFDDPFDASIEDMDVGDLRLDDVDDDAMEPLVESSATPPLSVGGAIVGFIQVILIALIVLAVFLALAFGAVVGAQRLNLLPTHAVGYSAPLVSAAPTQPPAGAPSNPQPNVPPGVPTATPDLGCSNAASWWNSQPIQSNYQYFTQQVLNDVRGGGQSPSALLEQMNIHRSYVANLPADPCLSDAVSALLHGFDATIDVARAINAGDPAALAQKQAASDQAYGKLTAALWAVSVNPDSSVPIPDASTRDSGAACGAQAWYNSVKPHVDAYNSTAQQIDVVNMAPSAVTNLLNNLQAERGNVAAIQPPDCAAQAQQYLLAALDSRTQAFQQQLAGSSPNSALANYSHQNQLFLAWQQWLGIS